MRLIKASEAPRFELPGLEFAGFAAPSRGSAELCAWRLTVAPGTVGDAPHTLDRDEVFLVVSGAIRLAPGGEVVAAGDAAVVPAGEGIQLSNASAGPAEVIVAIRAGFTAKTADGQAIGTPPWAL
jgi:mannose-6-phosphate isomerase-like protein (cupin superfamily)